MAGRKKWRTYEEAEEMAARGTLDDSTVVIPPYDMTDEEILAAAPPELRDELRQELQAARAEQEAAEQRPA